MKSFLLISMHRDGANAHPHYQKLCARAIPIWDSRRGQPSHAVQWTSLALKAPPCWSWYPPRQVSMNYIVRMPVTKKSFQRFILFILHIKDTTTYTTYKSKYKLSSLIVAQRGPQKFKCNVIWVSRSTEIFSKRRKIYSLIETRPDCWNAW
jgi:hypothetical protein